MKIESFIVNLFSTIALCIFYMLSILIYAVARSFLFISEGTLLISNFLFFLLSKLSLCTRKFVDNL